MRGSLPLPPTGASQRFEATDLALVQKDGPCLPCQCGSVSEYSCVPSVDQRRSRSASLLVRHPVGFLVTCAQIWVSCVVEWSGEGSPSSYGTASSPITASLAGRQTKVTVGGGGGGVV